jgi:hypothetical protein
VSAKRPKRRALAVSFLMALPLLISQSGCSGQDTCARNTDCAPNQMCARSGQGPLQCLDSCAQDGTCRPGFTCEIIAMADCLACDVVVRACVVAPPPLPKL